MDIADRAPGSGVMRMLVLVPLTAMVLLTACGTGERKIPKEETGEPNTIPLETQMYRDARSAFRSWVQLFQRPRVTDTAYSMLSDASVRRLRALGVRDSRGFVSWVNQQAQKNRTPFSYEFSRFDILDIDVRDTTRAIVTATFLVHIRQSSFESVSSFTLLREKGHWKIPFAESGNFESSWWQKEENFSTRIREEGLRFYRSDSLHLSFRFPQAWDVTEDILLSFAGSGDWPGIELQYVDPSTLRPSAVIRLAVISASETDTLRGTANAALRDSSKSSSLRVLMREETRISLPAEMHGSIARLLDPASGKVILFLTAVDTTAATYSNFSETFRSVRRSIQPQFENDIP